MVLARLACAGAQNLALMTGLRRSPPGTSPGGRASAPLPRVLETRACSPRSAVHLLRNHSARDPIARISAGIGFVVVRLGVDDDGGTVGQQRARPVCQADLLVLEMHVRRCAIGPDHEVPEIAGVVALGIVEAVFLAFGIEMSARGFEIGTLTFRHLMEMDGMFPGREIVKMEIDGDTGALVPENDVAHGFAPAVF